MNTTFHILSNENHYWEHDYHKAREVFIMMVLENGCATLKFEEWEGEAGGEGAFYEYIIMDYKNNC